MASSKRKAADQEPLQEPTSSAGRELEDVICTICQDYLTDPVTIQCGHNFCRSCISQRCARAKTASCPQCRKRFQKRAFRPNMELGSLVQHMKQKGKRKRTEDVCTEHGKALRWICKDDGKALCEDCKGSPAHCTHMVVSMGKAALKTKCQHKPGPSRADTCPTAMASAATAGELQEEAICPICLGYLTEPVTIACGHNFCRACLTRHCELQGANPPACPQCRAPFQKGKFKPNTQLRNIVQKLQQLGPQPGAGRTEGLCERHEERLKLFCQEDGAAICLVCEKSRDHKSHTVMPIEEAAQEYKEKLQGALGPLRKQLEEAQALTSKEEKKTTDWQNKVQAKRETIEGEFNKLHTLLREEERLLLQRLAEEERETLQRLQENVTKLSQQSASLQQLITEMEGKCQQPVVELLKDVKSTLSRSENMKLQEPEAVCTDLQRGYKICLDLREALNRFAVDVTLDPDTAHPKLILSEDRKRVRDGDTRQDLPDTPERFDTCVFVLGAAGFTGGRRYWEVEVGDKTGWDLGVCRESVSRKGKVTLSPEDGYWVVWLRDGGYKALTSPPTPLPVSARPSWVGIFLDYEAGEVSFYNVTDRSHLFTFTGTFSGTLRPFFSPYLNAGGTNAAPLTICPVPAQAGGISCPQQ